MKFVQRGAIVLAAAAGFVAGPAQAQTLRKTMRSRTSLPARLVVLVLALLVLSCEIEDQITIRRDGSGTYRVKMLVEKQLASALPEIRKKAAEEGFRILENGETETRHFLLMERDFKNVSEVGDARNPIHFKVTKAGWLRERYELTASLRSSAGDGFSRQLTLALPGRIERSTAGEVRGNTIVWDCTKGGRLEATAVGFVLPPVLRWVAIFSAVIAAAAAVVMGILLLVLRRRPAAAVLCGTCGATKDSNTRFCANCGAADAVTAMEGTGG